MLAFVASGHVVFFKMETRQVGQDGLGDLTSSATSCASNWALVTPSRVCASAEVTVARTVSSSRYA